MSIAPLVTRLTKQTMVYWAYTGTDGYGKSQYSEPVELAVRWQDEQQVMNDTKGREFISKSHIIGSTDLTEKSRVYLGKLTDLTTAQKGDPTLVSKSYPIQRTMKNTDLGRSTFVAFEAWI